MMKNFGLDLTTICWQQTMGVTDKVRQHPQVTDMEASIEEGAQRERGGGRRCRQELKPKEKDKETI